MLPFLKPKKVVETIMGSADPKGGIDIDHEDDESSELEVAAQDVLDSLESKDAKSLAESLKAFFQMCDSYPHEEEAPQSDEE